MHLLDQKLHHWKIAAWSPHALTMLKLPTLETLLGNNHVAPQQGPRKNIQEIVDFDDHRTSASFLLLRKYHINCIQAIEY
jgi:hypothetical protein